MKLKSYTNAFITTQKLGILFDYYFPNLEYNILLANNTISGHEFNLLNHQLQTFKDSLYILLNISPKNFSIAFSKSLYETK